MATILPKKAGFEQPMALDDDHYTTLAADPSINQFPQGSSYGSTSFGNNSMSAGGFGSPNSFSSPDLYANLYHGLCYISNLMELITSNEQGISYNAMATTNIARCRSLSHRYGCCSWYCGLWSYKRKD